MALYFVFRAYLVISFIIALIIYPVFGHLVWGNAFITDNAAYLADKGFMDFAGSSYVHSIGGWVGLAGIIVIGPRLGKFDENNNSNMIPGHSYVLATAGAIILWIGFNGGTLLSVEGKLASIIINTVLAAVSSIIFGKFVDHVYVPHRPINGSLAGLVGVTASCAYIDVHAAIMIGVLSGFIVVISEYVIENIFKLDDVVGSVSVHGVCGATGTIMLAIFAHEDQLVAGGRLEQLLVQIEGVLICFIWAFGIGYISFKIMDKIKPIRVSFENEQVGLNKSEHGSPMGTGELQKTLDSMKTEDGKLDLRVRLDENTGDESAELAILINPFLNEMQNLVAGIDQQSKMLSLASNELLDYSSHFMEGSTIVTKQSSAVATSAERVSGHTSSTASISQEMEKKQVTL